MIEKKTEKNKFYSGDIILSAYIFPAMLYYYCVIIDKTLTLYLILGCYMEEIPSRTLFQHFQ